jgi:thiol-disulfide isomerase/thioredoxin
LIQSTIEIPSPPKEYYSDRTKYYTYLLEHQFDNYKWEDDRLINTPLPNNKFKFYSQVILELAPEIATPLVIKDLDKSKVSILHYYQFFDYLEIFFGSLTSPYRDEYLYIEMLKNALQFPQLSPERKARYVYELSVINKNLRGSIVPDFKVVLNNGDSTSLHKINAEYLLIYFQNPDCPSCIELRQKMESMDLLKKAIADKKMTVLTVYFESNEQIWRNYLLKSANPAYIHSWNYDLSIEKDKLFDTRTIPMLILVDKDKRVIKKDLLKNEIEYYMKMINP